MPAPRHRVNGVGSGFSIIIVAVALTRRGA